MKQFKIYGSDSLTALELLGMLEDSDSSMKWEVEEIKNNRRKRK